MKKFLILFLLFGCQSEISLPEKPEDVIPVEKMQVVLADITTLESAIEKEFVQLGKYYKILDTSILSYLSNQGISQQKFKVSLDYYNGQHEIGQKLYQDVLDTLNIRLEMLKKT